MAKKKSKEIVKAEPVRVLSPLEEMERRFEDFLRRPLSSVGPSWWPGSRISELEEITPSVDIFEEGNNVVVKAELPGMRKEDLDVKLTEESITISGEKRKEEKVEKKDYYRLERSYGSFSRSYRLPAEVQTNKAKAKFKDGILEIRVPVTAAAKKRAKKILIE